MFKYRILSAAAAASLMAAPALAQAAPVEVELEGKIESFDASTRTLVLMGMDVEIAPNAVIHSPTGERADTGLSMDQWLRGAVFEGRNVPGMINGTGIVIGAWDPVKGKIVANDVFAEPAENVALGVITDNFCNQSRCAGAQDFIRGNSKVGGAPGPAYKPIQDIRMAASGIRDETLFPLNVAGANLKGLAYAAEGYYGDVPVNVRTGVSGQGVTERAFHYFIFDLVNPAPQLFLNKTRREISVLRTRCNVGDRWEIRGYVHTTVNAQGQDNDATVNSNSGVISIQYTNANGQLVRVNGGAPTAVPGFPAIGQFRVRFDTPFCPESYNIRWLPTANSANGAAFAFLENVGIDRLREDAPEDD